MISYIRKLSPYMVVKGVRYLRHFGWKEFWIRLQERMEPEEVPYGPWYENYRPTDEELERQKKYEFAKGPVFSILVPCFHTPERYLREMIASVQAQTYPRWQLCLVNASPEDKTMASVLEEVTKDARISCVSLPANLGISGNTNKALEMAKGDFICLLDHDDLLSPAALWQMALYLQNHPETRMLYTDEDKVREDGKEHFQPHLKPDFNLDLLRSNNYICHFLAVRRDITLRTGGFREEYSGAQDYDFIFRCAEEAARASERSSSVRGASAGTGAHAGAGGASAETGVHAGAETVDPAAMTSEVIGHVPEILYHWRVHSASTADNPDSKRYAYEAGRKAIEAHLARCGQKGEVTMLKDHGFYRVHYPVTQEAVSPGNKAGGAAGSEKGDENAQPLVSVIIPNHDQKDVLRRCIASLDRTCAGVNMELLIVENNSEEPGLFEYYRELAGRPDVRLLRRDRPFNYSALNNYAARKARGKYLLFLNNDIEAISPGWLEEMLGVCMREDVGAVGARLYYPDDTIQHAGIVMGIGGVAASLFTDMKRERTGYLHKAALLQDLSAVTAACMLTKRDLFMELGGFEEALAVAFNDVDLCLRINRAGYRVVYDPYAELYHDESRSRGSEDTREKVRRFQNEIEFMRTNWTGYLTEGDPYYNKNLSRTKWNYSLRSGERMDCRIR